jgi:hypothetical protein
VKRTLRFSSISAALTLATFVAWCSTVPAQSGKGKARPKPASPAEVKQIDQRLQKLQDTFEVESRAIIDGYEKNGQFERAKTRSEE